MSDKTAVAVTTMKAAQAELTQWENRIEHAQSELARIKRESEILQGDIDAKRTNYESYIAGREKQIRDAQDKVSADSKTLEAQREEFKAILDQHQKDKAGLSVEKADFERQKSALEGQKRLCNDFIQAVRRAYTLIAE